MTDAFTKLFAQMMASGQDMARAMTPALDKLDPAGFAKMVPVMPADMLEMWFGKTFNRDGLDARTRFLLVIAGLVVQAGVPVGNSAGQAQEVPLRLAIRNAMASGASEREIVETIFQMSMFAGLPAMQTAFETAKAVFAEAADQSKSGDKGC